MLKQKGRINQTSIPEFVSVTEVYRRSQVRGLFVYLHGQAFSYLIRVVIESITVINLRKLV